MADFDEREEEFSSLSAIFPELLVDSKDHFVASLELAVTPTRPLLIRFVPSKTPEANSKTFYLGTEPVPVAYVERDVELTHLPPLNLQITLPSSYPAASPPIVRLSAQKNWLPKDKLAELECDAQHLWEEYGHCQILFAYIDHLQQAAERGFDLDQRQDGCLVLPFNMEERLVTFNAETKQAVFNAGTYDCGICIEPKKGSACYQLKSCGHIFCKHCLQDFYNNAIKEGDVASVKCLDPDCGKETGRRGGRVYKRKRRVQPKELLAMGIEESVVRRYVELKRKKKLEADKNTIYCPRKWCQGIARRKGYPPIPADLSNYEAESSSEEEADNQQRGIVNGESGPKNPKIPPAPGERLAVCEKCQYAFCKVCFTGWHGDFARCFPRDPNELSTEEKLSYDWIAQHTSPCPTCNSPTQKAHGCNHMKCFQCNTHFCYLCGSWLDGQNPYLHFNTLGTECYQRLFELEEGDEGQAPADGRGYVGARRWEQMAIEIAREAEAEEVAAVAQAEEDGRAGRGARVLEDRLQVPPVPNGPPVVEVVARVQLNAGAPAFAPPAPGAEPRNGARRPRNPFPAHAPARGAAHAVRNHERNQRGRDDNGARQIQARPALAVDDREQAELERFVELALRDEEDAWDSDDLGDDDELFVIR